MKKQQAGISIFQLGSHLDFRYFCVHGGLSPKANYLDEIQDVDRFQEPSEGCPSFDLLWSDPNDSFGHEAEVDDFDENASRGSGTFMFSYKAVTKFLENNNLHSMIRAHEAQRHGFKLHTAEGL